MLLHEWDVRGSNRHSMADVCSALQLLRLVRMPAGLSAAAQQPQSQAAADRPDSRQSTSSSAATKASGADLHRQQQEQQQADAGASKRVGEAGGGISACSSGSTHAAGQSLKEAFLRERISALEHELAQARSGGTATSTQQVGGCRGARSLQAGAVRQLAPPWLRCPTCACMRALSPCCCLSAGGGAALRGGPLPGAPG